MSTEAAVESGVAAAGGENNAHHDIPAGTHPHGRKRRLIGRVKSDKMDKTVVVETVRFKMDPVYKKYIRVRRKYKAHDENNEFRTGDRVEIIEHRPLSKEKRWMVTKLIERPQ